MKKNIYSILFIGFTILSSTLFVGAQTAFIAGNKSLEISGTVAGFYNYRVLKAGEDNYKNNKFMLRNAILGINGRVENKWEYELKADFFNISSFNIEDPENPGLVTAYIAYKSKPVDIKFGYDKVPYSQASLASIYEGAFWSRTQLTRGDFFSRRDIGLTLSNSYWNQRINVYLGAYTGLGEAVFVADGGDIDPSGNPEFIARVDVAYPSRYRYDDVDYKLSPIPMFRIGANIRYTDKTLPGDNTHPETIEGIYGLKLVDGKKMIQGFDASFAYMGFSAQVEGHVIQITPAKTDDILFHNTTEDVNKNKVFAGGIQAQLNYFFKPLKSTLSARYENYNLNDLVVGNAERLAIAYTYNINGSKNAIKIHYFKILKEEESIESLKWTDQVRLGWQYSF